MRVRVEKVDVLCWNKSNKKDLGAHEWIDYLFLKYGIEPPNLPSHCDGCGADFYIYHDLDCKKDGLITARHNEIRDGVADLARKAFNPAHVLNDPKIPTCRALRGG